VFMKVDFRLFGHIHFLCVMQFNPLKGPDIMIKDHPSSVMMKAHQRCGSVMMKAQ
jgi:hypothetical protein